MQPSKKSLLNIVLLGVALSFSSTSMAKIYKWTDANGKTHYTATPPPKSLNASKAEEFKVQKIKKSSLTNIDNTANSSVATTQLATGTKALAVDPTIDAQTQCKKAAKKMPAMYAHIKGKLDQSKKKGLMTDSQYDKALKQMKKAKNNKKSYADCVNKYNSGGEAEINQIANSNPEDAFTYLVMSADKAQKELEKQLKSKQIIE